MHMRAPSSVFFQDTCLLVLNTREIRIVLKTAWRLPRQAWLFVKTLRYAMLYLRSTRSLNCTLVKAYPAAKRWRGTAPEAAVKGALAECRA